MTQETGTTAARGRWPALAACLLDFEAFPGRYPLALREPRLLFEHVTEVLTLASGRTTEGLPQDEALEAQLRQAARFYVRTAMLRPGVDHYTLMGLTPAFEPGTLRDHYRMLMRLTHPDFVGGGRAWPADAATRINQANDVLSSAVSRQAYDRTLGNPRQPQRPAPPGPEHVRARPGGRPGGVIRRTTSPAARRAVVGTLTGAGLLAVGVWLFSGSGEPEADARMPTVSGLPAIPTPAIPAPSDARVEAAASLPPAPASPPLEPTAPIPESAPAVAAAAPVPSEPPPARPASAVVRPLAAETSLSLRPSRSLEGVWARPVPVPARAAVVPPAPATANAPAPVAMPLPPQVAVASPPGVPALAPVTPTEAPAPATRLSMDDIQPLLGHVLGALQSGRGEQVLRWVERPSRPGDGAEGFVQTYNRAVGNARSVRLGAVRLDGRPAAEGLQVDGVVLLHVQDENQQAATHELVLRAQFASRGGQAVLTRLNASETTR